MQLKINNDSEKKLLLEQMRMILNALEEYDKIIPSPITPDALQIQNHNNLLQSHPDAIEMTGDIIEKKRGHGGKRSGAGRKKGYRLSDTTKESLSLIHI